MKTAILLDSSCDLDWVQAEQLKGVSLLLQTVSFQGAVWMSQDELAPATLTAALRAGATPPINTPVSVAAYASTLERMLGRAEHVLALHPRQEGGVLEVAQQAAAQFPGRVTVCGVASVSVALAVLAQRALVWLGEGLAPQEVAARVQALNSQSRWVIYLPTTEFAVGGVGRGPVGSVRVPGAGQGAGLLVGGSVQDDARPMGTAPDSETGERMLRQLLTRFSRLYPAGELVTFHYAAANRTEHLRGYARTLGLSLGWDVALGLVLAAQVGPGAYGFTLFPAL